MAAVARHRQPRQQHDRCAGDREADDQVPRRRGLAERVGEVVPEPVLHVVGDRQEPGRHQRRRHADHRAQQHQPQVRPRVYRGRVGEWYRWRLVVCQGARRMRSPPAPRMHTTPPARARSVPS